ncbi:MAG: FtsH protease activity modulator HflK [Candidatus Omnitrophica bacterium]|nr:FtsH protease activity modulator HflK [Candidatus Omnitrophota bacterium]
MAFESPEDILRQGSQLMRWLPKMIIPAAVVAAGLWLATGFYMVGPGEVGVVRQFGKEVRRTEPGLRYRLPLPIERVNIVNVERIRRAEVGFRTEDQVGRSGPRRVSQEALMLTGDENIVEAQLIVQYQVKDPSLYLFRVHNPDEVLRTSTEVALRSMVGNATIDDLLTVGREKVQVETRDFLQRLLDVYSTGLRVTEVRLQVVDPPDQVKDAFHEVVRAREDREKLINQAQGYQEDIIPKARGRAQQMIREAEAFQEERVLRAQGDAARFVALLEEYRKAKEVTRTRLYLEALERTLRPIKKIIIDPRATGGIAPLLPLAPLQIGEIK